jgi:hypothetical protein
MTWRRDREAFSVKADKHFLVMEPIDITHMDKESTDYEMPNV